LNGTGIAGGPSELESISELAGLEGLARFVAELTRSGLPPAELVLHERFEALLQTIAARPRLLQERIEAFDRLRDRGFSPTLVERIPVDRLELEWQRASSAVWPLSWWQKNQLKVKLKPYMQPGREPDVEIDIFLLADYRTAVRALANNLDSLGLPPPLRQSVEQNPNSLDEPLAAARRLREVVRSVGGAPEQLGRLHAGNLQPLIAAVSQFATARESLAAVQQTLADNLDALPLPSVMRSVIQSDFTGFTQSLGVALAIRDSLRLLAGEATFGPLSQRSLSRLLAEPPQSMQAAAKSYVSAMQAFKKAWKEYTALTQSAPISGRSMALAADAAAQARLLVRDRAALRPTVDWNAAEQHAKELKLKAFTDDLLAKKWPPHEAVPRFELAYARWWLPLIIDERQPLRDFKLLDHERTIHEFRDADRRARESAPLRVLGQRAEELPDIDAVPRGSELFELRRQINDGRPRKSIRALIESMPTMFPLLAPCLLMSPLSIAQYLPANLRQFDVVVFDEASQITTWDAIGAIARGNQTIVVGDPNQLPPTSFFERSDDSDDSDEGENNALEMIRDMPSILDELITDGLPTVRLSWHYRSQHESLIAFSNRQYYEDSLATFPAADNRDRGVSFVPIVDAVYDRGRTRTNRREAEAIVADLVARMTAGLGLPEERRLTYGVVTFNKQQQDLIEDLLDEARRQQPELEWFFAEERFEPTMVKNLENVQGDERDVMLFSITFGFDAKGAFPVDFGALNREGGHRRLNVAVTRARRTLAVYASFLPDQLQASRSNARGVRDLRAFLEYAQSGATAFIGRNAGPPSTRDGQLEESIAKALTTLGWTIKQRVGVSDFRVDIGVVHPDRPEAFLAGVECDGERYGRSTVARDRDITRGVVLSSLGWQTLRVWSIDWWNRNENAKERLHSQLKALLQDSRIAADAAATTVARSTSGSAS
ncbi:MAG: AAA domain-containing protein, partial [Planctomycetota bacterium]